MADALDLEVKDLERVIKRNPISLSVFWTKWQQQERAGVPRNRRITMAEARNATPEQMVEIFTAAGMMPAEDADPNAESGSRAASMDT
jgi:hypothetical protein